MALRLFDTAARELRDFTPLTPGKVGMYICGLTTQGAPHLGHVRFAVAFDVLRRWLTVGHGYDVALVRNVTDIDDKILRKSAESGEDWFALSYRNERATTAALETLGIIPATYEPRATGHITEMIELIDTLVERQHAYPAPDDSGDVYFDVKSYADYGALSNQSLGEMVAADDADPRGKRDPRDFALWKGHKEGEPATASWPTPYGRGRPGWHLECSAMARKYLGDTFDIHGGGIDLRFPHHENEQAQSRAAGLGFAQYWLHNAWVTVKGEKMGKSLGNALEIHHLLETHTPLTLRYFLTAAHYRSTIEYHEGSLTEAGAALERIEGFLRRALPGVTTIEPTGDETLPEAFRTAMDDDLGVSGALAAIHEAVREGNTSLDEGDRQAAAEVAHTVVAMADVLGINPLSAQWVGGGDGAEDDTHAALDALVQQLLVARTEARQSRDFATADAIRDQLSGAGIALEDTAAGVRWSLAKHTKD
ncbi:cysteine--tRNA ligase [Kribbia dieselivorans]|uniref:cysteine--tRNA ligase n=1 Tax=Kribbia dieselivorans TaxID=331526 RepID=UPI00083862B5|nr:cysteine--tRNA ligase [Kribbia dieselivorans]